MPLSFSSEEASWANPQKAARAKIKTKTFFKKYGLGEPSPVTKSYYVRVYDKGHLIDEVKFCNAVDAQNYIQKTELFYSNLV